MTSLDFQALKLWCGWNLCRSTTDKRWGVLCQFSVRDGLRRGQYSLLMCISAIGVTDMSDTYFCHYCSFTAQTHNNWRHIASYMEYLIPRICLSLLSFAYDLLIIWKGLTFGPPCSQTDRVVSRQGQHSSLIDRYSASRQSLSCWTSGNIPVIRSSCT